MTQLGQSSIRVLLANDRLGYDDARFHGAGRLMVEWTRALIGRGLDVTSVILRDPGLLGPQVLADGLPFVFLRRHPYDPRTLGDFLRLIRKHRIQILHLQAFGASTFGRLAARMSGVPAIVHVHADYRQEPKGYPWFVRVVDHALSSSTPAVLAVAETVADFAVRMQGFVPEQVQVLHNPVDLRHFRPPIDGERQMMREALGLKAESRCVICLARFHPVKGVDILVNAWQEVAGAVPDAVLLLVGDGPMRPELEARARELGLETNIRFLGYRQDVDRLLWAADLAVLPSRSEGLCVAALEAMATGLPLVATRVGGNPEIVREGQNGYLVPSEHPAELGRAIAETLNGRRKPLERLSSGALVTAKEHSIARFAERLESFYKRFISAYPQCASAMGGR